MDKTAPYWNKNGEKDTSATDLAWNFPEQKSGSLAIIGGNSSAFTTEVKISEYLSKTFPMINEVKNLFPDALKKSFPSLPTLDFFPSTDSGSFADSSELRSALQKTDLSLFLGDFSKNSATSIAISNLIKTTPGNIVLARDSVDLVLREAESFIDRENLIILASMAQLQKLFRALYYPKVLLLSEPLFPVVETLHKFTLSYSCTLLTFHDGKILLASHGKIVSICLENTDYTPISLWSGELAAKISAFFLFNPKKPLESCLAGLFYQSKSA
ncbi:hypothetical protein IJH27_01230 [Candidatus Saccharibacteria bacterium]|nr:hypothetical protein [Candidatus Saccharibacteria bacterium]